MGVLKGLMSWAEAVGSQLTHKMNFWRYEPDKREIHFSKAFQESAKKYNISDSDALDVYYHGYMAKPNMMERKYNGYKIGIYYFMQTIPEELSSTKPGSFQGDKTLL